MLVTVSDKPNVLIHDRSVKEVLMPSYNAPVLSPSTSPLNAAMAPQDNRLLASLPTDDLERLRSHLKFVALPQGMTLHESGHTINHVYFPTSGMVSSVLFSAEGTGVEVGIVGAEGIAGAEAVLDGKAVAMGIMQIGGDGFRLPATVLRDEFQRGGALHTAVLEYVQATMIQSAQCALCIRLHTVDERLARWLLTASNRIKSDSLALTQEFVAQMLGARRSGVTVAAGNLREAGLIDYTRGRIQILDVAGLERRACECHRVIEHKMDNLFLS